MDKRSIVIASVVFLNQFLENEKTKMFLCWEKNKLLNLSDDEDEDELDEIKALSVNSTRSGMLQKPTRCEGFIYRTIPNYNETEFQSHFRLESSMNHFLK